MPDDNPWSRRRPSGRAVPPAGDGPPGREGSPGEPTKPPGRIPNSDTSPSIPPPGPAATQSRSTVTSRRPQPALRPRKGRRIGLVGGGGALLMVLVGLIILVATRQQSDVVQNSPSTDETTKREETTTTRRESTTSSSVVTTTPDRPSTGVVDWDSISRSVVFIEASSPCEWRGSGTLVLDGSYVLTNQHVSSNGECALRVGLTDGLNSSPQLSHDAEVLIADETLDLAVLRLFSSNGEPFSSNDHQPVKIDYEQPPLGSEIATLGYPALGSYDAGMTITFTRGTFSGLDFTDGEFFKTDATMRGGVSGGGAFNDAGNLIGVPTGGLVDEETSEAVGINLIRPARFAKKLLEEAQASPSRRIIESGRSADDSEFEGTASTTDPRFDTCREAIDNGYGPYIAGIDVEYDWYTDRDGDGIVCER
jgi:S1-C subfamily serine protease